MIFSRNPAKRRVQKRTAVVTAALTLGAMTLPMALLMSPTPEPTSTDYWGTPVEIDRSPVTRPMKFDVLKDCAISAFGTHPWLAEGKAKGEEWEIATRWALAKQGVPDEIIGPAVRRLRGDASDATIRMGNTHGITGNGRYFLPIFTTTYRSGERWAVCRNSRTNFINPHRRESAPVHLILHGGVEYWFGHFESCNNVTRFTPAPPGWIPGPSGPSASPPAAPQGQAAPNPSSGGGAAPGGPNATVHEVPEPGSIVLFAAALAGLIWFRRNK
jgi:hypothetical protein